MKSYLKQYIVTIKTAAPVFIGAGKKAGKKEYLYDRNSGKISFININKTYHELQKRNLGAEYEEFLMDTSESDLSFFLKRNKVSYQESNQWIQYSVSMGDSNQNSHSLKEIELFLKDAYGQPFIPGSSIKGMLRTMLETEWFIQNEKEQKLASDKLLSDYSYREKRNRYLQQDSRYLSEKAFHRDLFPDAKGMSDIKNAKNDILRGLLISDSDPIERRNLTVCQKIDVRPDGVEKPLNLMRECIRPRVEVKFCISIDTAICPYTFEDLMNINRSFFAMYKRIFMSRFPEKYQKTRGNSTTFFLGGGAGYVSKTVSYGVLPEDRSADVVNTIIGNTLPETIRKKHGYDKGPQFGIAPHTLKCTKYQGNYYQMGTCYLKAYSAIN